MALLRHSRRNCFVILTLISVCFFTIPVQGQYCSASGGCDEYIYGVSLGSINTWGTACSNYANYTSMSTIMELGTGYPISIVTAVGVTPYSGYTGDQCGIWVDWNQDGDFYDLDETVYTASGLGLFTTTITPPMHAISGDTRIRIRLTYIGTLSPCGDTTYGEVEDYTVTIPSSGPQTRIYGKKWHDLNDNNLMEGGEPPLSGWTIFLDENYNGQIDPNDIVTTTDIQGNYEFTGIEPNEYYYVSEVDQNGWINTYPGAGGIHYRIWVEENNDIELNFGNYQLHNCDINGYKFHDVNNNGVWDDSEGPLSGWEIYIDENQNGQWDSGEPKTTTSPTGYYEFTDLEPGYHNIMEVPQAGWFQTYPGLTSGRLWGLEGRMGEGSTIAEVNLASMAIESRFAAPYPSTIIGIGALAAGPSTLFYCPLKFTSMYTADSLIFEIDCETGLVIYEGVLEMPENEVAWNCAWHNGILYVISVEVPFADPRVIYLNRYDAITKELISRDLLVPGSGDGLASDSYEDVLLSNLAIKWTVYEIDPDTAGVVKTIKQQLPIRTSMAYTQGVLYKTHFGMEEMLATHRYDGSLLSTEVIGDYVGFDALAGGIGAKGGHRIWIGKRDVEANFGNRLDSEASLSGTKYEDVNGNGQRDANEPGIPDWPIYIDLDGDMNPDAEEPNTLTDANGNWTIEDLVYGRYFVREVQEQGYTCTEPKLGWVNQIDVNRPRDIVFDDMRNLLYVSTEAGEIQRFNLSTNQFLSPITVGGSPHGMDIAADYSSLYVADTQLIDGNGIVHKVNLDTLDVTNLTYTVGDYEDGSYDIAIGSEGIALVTASYDGSGLVPLYVLDTATDNITVRPDVLGQTTINDEVRVVRSYDRTKIWLINNSSNGWIAVYDAPSDTFVAEKEFYQYLNESPIALNHDGSMAAVQLNAHCRIVDANFNMVMGLDDSNMAAAFDPSSDLFYQFHHKWNVLFAVDTVSWELLDHVLSEPITETYQKFTRGETAITADGRVLAVTDPNFVALYRMEHYIRALPGRTVSGLDFGNKTLLCGDFDDDRDVDFLDLRYISEQWLSEGPFGFLNLENFACLAGNWKINENIIEYDEDFETGDFSNLPWEHAGDGPWIITSSLYFEGSYCAKSADLPAWEDESILRLTTTCGDGNIYFMVRVGASGWFRFKIDEELMFDWDSSYDGGLLDWSLVSIPVSAGTHTFEFSTIPGVGDDFAWIDAIRFPPAND